MNIFGEVPYVVHSNVLDIRTVDELLFEGIGIPDTGHHDILGREGGFQPGFHTQPVKTVSEQMADVLAAEVLAQLDYQIDFHSGGDNHSVHMIEFTRDPVSKGMARAFNMPVLLFDEWRSGQMWRESERLGAKVIVAEGGGGGALYNEWVERSVQGTFNVKRYLDMLVNPRMMSRKKALKTSMTYLCHLFPRHFVVSGELNHG